MTSHKNNPTHQLTHRHN